MSDITAQIIPGTLPTDCYPASAQAFYNLLAQLSTVLVPGLTGIIISDTQPSANDRDKAWIRTNVGAPLYGYAPAVWYNAAWVIKHPTAASGPERRLWASDATTLQTYDGGDTNPAGDASGPMWEIDHTADARFLLGPGTFPSTTVVAVNATGGNEKVILTPDQFQHMHGVAADGGTDDPPTMLSRVWTSVKNFTRRINDLNTSGATGWHDDPTPLSAGTMGTTEPYVDGNFPTSTGHDNVPPYLGIYVIKRTARIYLKVA